MNEWSLRFERNAMRFPSGDQRGVSLSPANSSSCSAFFLPSIGAIQRCFFAGQRHSFRPVKPADLRSLPRCSRRRRANAVHRRSRLPPTPAASAFLSGLSDLPTCLPCSSRCRARKRSFSHPASTARSRSPGHRRLCNALPVAARNPARPATQMLRSPLLSNTQATRGACDALVRPYGNGALSTCSMVKLSAKQQTGKRTETTATQRSGSFFTAARLYSPSGALSKINESGCNG